MKTVAIEKKSLNAPDEVRKFDKGKLELATLGGFTFGRATFQPGWKWSTCVKPIAKTESCQAPHTLYQISGTMKVVMEDGAEVQTKAGDVAVIGARQRADRRVLDLAGDRLHRLEIAVGGRGEAGLDYIHAQALQLARDAQFLVLGHRGTGRLLAVAQGGVEDEDFIVHSTL